jgi:hypothetical protein
MMVHRSERRRRRRREHDFPITKISQKERVWLA